MWRFPNTAFISTSITPTVPSPGASEPILTRVRTAGRRCAARWCRKSRSSASKCMRFAAREAKRVMRSSATSSSSAVKARVTGFTKRVVRAGLMPMKTKFSTVNSTAGRRSTGTRRCLRVRRKSRVLKISTPPSGRPIRCGLFSQRICRLRTTSPLKKGLSSTSPSGERGVDRFSFRPRRIRNLKMSPLSFPLCAPVTGNRSKGASHGTASATSRVAECSSITRRAPPFQPAG